ncbi:hypothetical protein GCM10007108_01410 [Thermogymnomonas acidicola]|uniref:Uncharacterized protein n=1 Tax=Thermogymnomonas acidicola TaxID=399579 RepID=A0AA37BPT3_9ARCH|nr:hypothetical protein [Thermogymnomonas acidicola]GGM66993.1 hypothetical protein GCM10007108_01410 [Thermogymnomonas acidicola]
MADDTAGEANNRSYGQIVQVALAGQNLFLNGGAPGHMVLDALRVRHHSTLREGTCPVG